jgi:transglutaminase-like putative cysteine protease
VARTNEGTQEPQETLAKGGGTCRDYALLMIETVRALGFAARFVSDYPYDPALDGGPLGIHGAGATHTWVQVYLPGTGWVEFDPTNGIVGGRNLIRVGMARDPAQGVPLAGTFFGDPDDFLGLDVGVLVQRVDGKNEPAALSRSGTGNGRVGPGRRP